MENQHYKHIIQRLERIERLLESVDCLLTTLRKEETEFMADMKTEMAALATQVQANTDAENSAVILINGIAARITAAAGDPAQVTALAAQLKASADALGAAVVANTPPAA